MIRNRFCKILQNLHFADNTYNNKTDTGFKVRPVIDHLNKKFPEVLSNKKEQYIDEHKWWSSKDVLVWNNISNLNLSNTVLSFGSGVLAKLGICTKWTFI